MKTLAFSVPRDDHHYTYHVNSKNISFVDYILESNDYEYDEGVLIDQVEDTLFDKIDEIEGSTFKEKTRKYFQKLIEEDVSLQKFSQDLTHIISTRRGSWSSFCWIKQ